MSDRPAYDALVEHFAHHPRTDAAGIAHNAIAVLLSLPVEQRMEAMGMGVLRGTKFGTDKPVFVELGDPT